MEGQQSGEAKKSVELPTDGEAILEDLDRECRRPTVPARWIDRSRQSRRILIGSIGGLQCPRGGSTAAGVVAGVQPEWKKGTVVICGRINRGSIPELPVKRVRRLR